MKTYVVCKICKEKSEWQTFHKGKWTFSGCLDDFMTDHYERHKNEHELKDLRFQTLDQLAKNEPAPKWHKAPDWVELYKIQEGSDVKLGLSD